jgi:TetR/AcrR family transcriptional regulator, transcriptional repressor for nem operon
VTKSEKTRQFIIEQTAPLFNKKGFDGTTLSDLTRSTGLTKGALYGNFDNKDDIATEAFKYSVRKVKKLVSDKVAKAPTFKKQLVALLEFYAEYVSKPPVAGGCPLLNSAIEADDHRLTMRKVVAKELMSTIEFIAGLIKKGIKAGEFVNTVKPYELAYVLFCSIEGALMFARVERSREPMEIIVRHCKKIVDQISK